MMLWNNSLSKVIVCNKMKYQLTDCVIFYKESAIANTSLSVDQVLLVTFSGVKMAGRATDVVRI